MTRTRILLNTAGLIALVLAIQAVVLELWNLGILGVEFASGALSGGDLINGYLFLDLLVSVLHCAAFGLGVFLALRYFAPVVATDSWRRTIIRGVLATVSGAVVAFAFYALVSLISAITIGAHPFGYALSAGVDASQVQYGIWNTIGTALNPLILWLPLTVLGVVFLKLWLAAHPTAVEATDRASVSA
jgi:hypothetical protein